MDSVNDPRFFSVGVSPFGNLRVDAYFQLSAAYRRLSRPSSALDAKAFTLCSSSLEQSFASFSSSLLKAENKSVLLAWVSQIIVGLCRFNKKASFSCYVTLFVCVTTCLLPYAFGSIVVFPLSERPLIPDLNHIKNLFVQLSVRFFSFLFGFQWTFAVSLLRYWWA